MSVPAYFVYSVEFDEKIDTKHLSAKKRQETGKCESFRSPFDIEVSTGHLPKTASQFLDYGCQTGLFSLSFNCQML